MSKVIIACEMLENELKLAMAQTGCTLPVEWMERGLHEWPEMLRAALQERLDGLPDEVDCVLFAMGLCGNALLGLHSARAALVAPRFDDCIRLLTAREAGTAPEVDCHSLYFTGAWFGSERFLVNGYQACVEKYGQKRAKRIYERMLGNYRSLTLLDTGAYEVAAFRARAEAAAALFSLEPRVERGTCRVLNKLLDGAFDDEFVVVKPGETFTQGQFLFPCRGEGAQENRREQ